MEFGFGMEKGDGLRGVVLLLVNRAEAEPASKYL